MKCIVVGGGVIGTSIAWHLAKQGVGEVVLLERDRLGSGTTWHSAGNITWKPSRDHDAPILYAMDTLDRLKAEVGQETGWLKTGRMFIARSAETRRNFEAFDRTARERGIAARWIEPADAGAVHPLLDPSAVEAVWLNSLSGRLNPADLTAAYAGAARRAGATIRENIEVYGLSVTGGRVAGIETSEGLIVADAVVMAAGLWSRRLLEPLGVALAQWACEHFYVIADVSPRLARETPSFVAPDDLLYGREEVGRFLVGCFDENAKTLDPAHLPKPFSFTLLPPDWDKIAPYFERASRLFPALATAPIRHFVNGPESFTPDGAPLIGRVGAIDGLFVATAMNSTGVTWSAMTGALIADLVTGTKPRFDARPYDPVRFGDRGRDLDWLKAQISAVVSLGYRNQNR
ncbi:MAG TPA: FAD-binding oxidoreductase [Stellaceae bacterium]|jgi:4-methylaminobutanoate oxidase (formaldehyde-forming)|nr:FAD-binding oxidoreductase [Stellaceae bacterium]